MESIMLQLDVILSYMVERSCLFSDKFLSRIHETFLKPRIFTYETPSEL